MQEYEEFDIEAMTREVTESLIKQFCEEHRITNLELAELIENLNNIKIQF